MMNIIPFDKTFYTYEVEYERAIFTKVISIRKPRNPRIKKVEEITTWHSIDEVASHIGAIVK